jgi:hypothetical protein
VNNWLDFQVLRARNWLFKILYPCPHDPLCPLDRGSNHRFGFVEEVVGGLASWTTKIPATIASEDGFGARINENAVRIPG